MLVNITEHYFLQIICPGFFFSLVALKCHAILACCSATHVRLSFVHILLAYGKGYGSKSKQIPGVEPRRCQHWQLCDNSCSQAGPKCNALYSYVSYWYGRGGGVCGGSSSLGSAWPPYTISQAYSLVGFHSSFITKGPNFDQMGGTLPFISWGK